MQFLLAEQKISRGDGATGTIDNIPAFQHYYRQSKGSKQAMAVGFYLTYGWWSDEKMDLFKASVTNRFCKLYPNLQLLSGRNGRCAKNLLDKIITAQKTKMVDAYRSGLGRGKRAEGVRVWLKNNKNGDAPFCFEANCHFKVIRNGKSSCFAIDQNILSCLSLLTIYDHITVTVAANSRRRRAEAVVMGELCCVVRIFVKV